MNKGFMQKMKGVFSNKEDPTFARTKKIDIMLKGEEMKTEEEVSTNPTASDEGSSDSKDGDEQQYDETETYFVKPNGDQAYDMKIEHFDDMLQDNSVQTSWAGLDSQLIDEEFLYLEDEEADEIYKELKQRQTRRRNMEEGEMRLNNRIRELELLAE